MVTFLEECLVLDLKLAYVEYAECLYHYYLTFLGSESWSHHAFLSA